MSPFGFLRKNQREAKVREKAEVIKYITKALRSFTEEDQCKRLNDLA